MEEKNKANHYYISLPSQKAEADIIDFEVRMLEQNRIRGLLPAAREYQDAEVKLYFDISGRQNLEQKYAWQKLTGREIKQILRAIADVAAELEEYMLDYNHLNLMPEYMYGMLDPGDLCFCYEPWDSGTFAERIRPLALWFLDHMDYREREEVIFSYEFQRFCDENDVSPALLGQFMAEKTAAESPRSRRDLQNMWESGQAAETDVWAKPEPAAIRREEKAFSGGVAAWEEAEPGAAGKKSGGMRELLRRIFPQAGRQYPGDLSMEALRFAEDETEYGRSVRRRREKEADRVTVEEEVPRTDDATDERSSSDGDVPGGETAGEARPATQKAGELVSESLPPLSIRGYPCFLGSDGDFTDCAIADESVSRIHARLFLSEGRVWAEDLHSEFGTFLNGDRMTPDEPWVLKDGDELKIGRCPYHFHSGKQAEEP